MTISEMILKGRQAITAPLKFASRPFRKLWPRFAEALVGMLALVLVAFALLTYSSTLASYASELFNSNRYVALISGLLNPFRNQHFLLNSGLPIYDLKVKRQELVTVENAVQQARKQGWMSDELKLWADAKFIYQGQTHQVKVRVRGELSPHWKGPKKSWRIKFGNENIEENGKAQKEAINFQGKKQINLIIPSDRDYILSYFVNSLMREKGLVALRDRFVILRINGIVQGLYYEVEHFDNPLLAASRRPETTVFGQNDRAMHFEQYTKYGTAGASDARYELGSIRRVLDNEDEGMRAMQVLNDHSLNPTPENFRRVRAVLDWEKYLRFRVMTTLCNTNHVRFGTDNLRLYYDASRGLLEPIPWDLHILRMPKEPGTIDFWNSHGPDEIQRATLMDPELRLRRNKILWELVSDGGAGLMEKYDTIHRRIRPLAWADVLSTPIQGHKMDLLREDLLYNIRRVHKVLNLSTANFTYRLDAFDRAALEITALNFSGIQLQKVELSAPQTFEGSYLLYEDTNHNNKLDDSDPLVGETTSVAGKIRFSFEKLILPQVKYGGDFIDGRYWEYFDTLAGRTRFFLRGKLTPAKRDPLEWTPPSIQVAAVNAVGGQQMPSAPLNQAEPPPQNAVGIVAYDASRPFDLEAPELDLAAFLRAHPEFSASREQAGAAELRGRVTIAGTVIVPKSVPLTLRPGADITMMPSASVLCYGGLTAIGTPEDRIRIHDRGNGEAWGVFTVVRPPKEVVMKYVDVQGGSQAKLNGILFTGGFAVHNGDLTLENCRFVNMQSEDSVNLKNGHILMKDCLIRGSSSDGIDLDFVTGEVRNSLFIDNKGDGVDLSGSKVTVAGNRFEHMGDKGISVGEDSHPVIINNLIRGCQIGISAKDLSMAKVAYCTFVENALAIEAKRKKPMFGGGSGEFINNVFSENKVLMTQDYFSRGQVTLRDSLLDEEVDCQTCQLTSEVRFRSPEKGDYRLSEESLVGNRFTLAQPKWAQLDGHMPQLPGLFGHLRDPEVLIQTLLTR